MAAILNFVILFAHKRACDSGDGSVSSERVAGSRLFGTDSFATTAAAAVAVVVRARARAALTAGRAAAVAAWTSERARVALSTGATADPRAWSVIAKRGGCPALRVPNDVCLETLWAAEELRLSTRGSPTSEVFCQGTVIINRGRVHSMSYCRLSTLS